MSYNNYQDIKFFNKRGYEIPQQISSNIVVKIYKDNKEKATIMNGVYMNNTNEDKTYFIVDEFKILDCGCDFDSSIITQNDATIEVFVDGKMIDDVIVNSFNVSKTKNFNIAYTTSNADLNDYVGYGIEKMEMNISIPQKYNLIFPSVVFESDIEMESVSTELHSVETIYLGVIDNGNLIKPYLEKYNLVFITDIKDDDIQFFVADKITDEIYKRHRIEVDLSDSNTMDDDYFDMTENDGLEIVFDDYIKTNIPQINICFSSKCEGVHEQKIYVLLQNRNDVNDFLKIGEINVSVEAIGEDERFRTLFANFGVPDPITYPNLFKSADNKEEKINWELVNMKSKELFLSYDEIFPYVGTYKALINAIKFLGYDDVYFREWYKDIKNNITYTKRLNINEDFNDYVDLSSDNVLESRMAHKKLNKLTLVYKLNEETDKYDEYDNPIIRNVYSYSVDEVLLKIESLKKWLERNIIALNCRIVDITGEGVVYEKQAYNVYGSVMHNLKYEEFLEFEPFVQNKIEKLVDGSANIKVSILNNSNSMELSFDDFDETIGQYANSDNGTIKHPFNNNLYVKAFVECDIAKITGNIKDNNSLFVNKGEIFASGEISSIIQEVEFEKAPNIYIKNANIRVDSSNLISYSEWWNKIEHTIKSNKEYIVLEPINEKASLKYSSNNKLSIPLFTFKGYKIRGDKNIKLDVNKEYFLEIIDGKIINEESENKTSYLIFNYDDNNKEQTIKVNYKYEGVQFIDYNIINNGTEKIYTPYFNLNVNNIGKYKIMAYAINDYGNIFAKEIIGGCEVIIANKPKLVIATEQKHINNDPEFFNSNAEGLLQKLNITSDNIPFFKWKQPIYDLKYNSSLYQIMYPNVSYAYETPKREDYIQITNLHDKIKINSFNEENKKIECSLLIKNSNFYNIGDCVQLVVYSKLCLNGIYEAKCYIENIDNNNYTLYIASNNDYDNIKKYEYDYVDFYIFNINENVVLDAIINIDENETDIFVESGKKTYKEGDIVKIVYNINDLSDYLYTKMEDGSFEEVYYINGEDFTVVKYDDNIENITSVFSGSATFRVKKVDNEKGIITINGKFSYNKSIVDSIFYKKVNDEKLYPLEFENDEIIVTGKYNKDIKTNIFITKSNQNYVNYVMRCVEDGVEKEDNNTVLKTSKNRLYDYIDDTYTLTPMSFNKLNAFEYWIFNDVKGDYYFYEIPITISKKDNIIISNFTNNKEFNPTYRIYRVYKQNLLNKTRELLFEVENKNLPINIKDEGIYDIESLLFDKYGNISYIDRQAFIKVK